MFATFVGLLRRTLRKEREASGGAECAGNVATLPNIERQMKGKRILYINQEVEPYIEGSQLAKQGGILPRIALESGAEVRTFIPKYGTINERRNQLHDVHRLSGLNLLVAKEDYTLLIKVASIPGTRLQVYFIDNLEFFSSRHGVLYEETGAPYSDNDRRGVFFCKGVLETIKKLRWRPDIIHCNGWLAGYLPPLVRLAYKHDPIFSKTKVITSLYQDNLTELAGSDVHDSSAVMKLPEGEAELVADGSHRTLSELAIRYSDGVAMGEDGVDDALLTYTQAQGKPVFDLRNPEQLSEVYEKLLADAPTQS